MSAISGLISQLSDAERALLAAELSREPVAIVGMGCRFPGGARSPEAFWRLLEDEKDAVIEVPPGRWDVDALYSADPAAPGKMITRWGGFLADPIDRFEPDFFGISPREASRMDPQQRLLLEVAWEALEDAGQPSRRVAGSATGVFVGSTRSDYEVMSFMEPASLEAYSLAGTGRFSQAGRISFLFDLRGPSLTVDTACSSSLVGVHLACQSLRLGECRQALACGVNLMIWPATAIALSKAGTLSPDGRCKTFDAKADGYSRGEGCGVVVLKRLRHALEDEDRIYAVIRGSAVNHGGHSSGFTVPNSRAQREVCRAALADAGVEPSEIGYVEAHGTGTSLGDPIEIESLTEVYGRPATDGPVCVLGSAKTNIGHLEPAAGVAGLIKAALSLERESIPAHLHLRRLNPNISLEKTRFVLAEGKTPWPRGPRPRYAAISSFGISGTNAHAVLGEAPVRPRAAERARAGLLALTAHKPERLRLIAERYREFIAGAPDLSLGDLCFTAGERRTHLDSRLAIAFGSREELLDRLGAFAAGQQRPGMSSGQRAGPPKCAFVFCGQGPQWWAMGRQLLDAEPAFASAVADCDRIFAGFAKRSLLRELRAAESESRLDDTEIAQPALAALQLGLLALWRDWGVEPQAVVGHSVGEMAAAQAAGVLSLEETLLVAYHRGRLMARAAGLGRMAAVGMSRAQAEEAIRRYDGRISIAADNGPASTVVSGETLAIEELLAGLERQNVLVRRVKVDYAFHSRQMDPFADELARSLSGLAPKPPNIPLFSTLSGEPFRAGDFGGRYWARNIRETVAFRPAVEGMIEGGYEVFIEIGPHPVLATYLLDGLARKGSRGTVLASLRRGADERTTMLGSLGALFSQGQPIRFERLAAGGRCLSLPPYPWQGERHWLAGSSHSQAVRLDSPSAAPPSPRPPAKAPPIASLASETEPARRRTMMQAYLMELASELLGHPPSSVRPQASLPRLGLDSLTAHQLKARLETDLGISVSVGEVLKDEAIAALAAALAGKAPGHRT